jgi:hypothetical protein
MGFEGADFIISLSSGPTMLGMFRLRSIGELPDKIKAWAHFIDRRDVYAICTILFVGITSYLLGTLSMIQAMRPPVTIEELISSGSFATKAQNQPSTTPREPSVDTKDTRPGNTAPKALTGMYVGSRTSDKYHLPTCLGAKSIRDENKVWFASKIEAENAGYTPAGNCKGI